MPKAYCLPSKWPTGILSIFLALQSYAQTEVVVLGIAQDAGAPQINCNKACCAGRWDNLDHNFLVSSLGVINKSSGSTYLIDCTPDFPEQNKILQESSGTNKLPQAIFLTHAHIGHYTGLMYLGKESVNSRHINCHVMPRMAGFLVNNGPWSQLVTEGNILLDVMTDSVPVYCDEELKIRPLLVPHRDEFSETVGFIIEGPQKKLLFIPDIDKWSKWKLNINELITKVDYALLDGTFFNSEELPGRDLAEIPHPTIQESMDLFSSLSDADKNKVYFIHLNHSNPALNDNSDAKTSILSNGFNVVKPRQRFKL